MRCYQNKRYNIKQRDEGTLDNRRRDGGTNFILRIKEQETRLILHEHVDDDDDILCENKKGCGCTICGISGGDCSVFC